MITTDESLIYLSDKLTLDEIHQSIDRVLAFLNSLVSCARLFKGRAHETINFHKNHNSVWRQSELLPSALCRFMI